MSEAIVWAANVLPVFLSSACQRNVAFNLDESVAALLKSSSRVRRRNVSDLYSDAT